MATTAPAQPEPSADAAGSTPLAVPLALVVSAGLIHVLATLNHVADSWLRGAFFALAAVAQLAAGAWMYRRPDDRRALLAAGIPSAAIALVWVFSRTTGLPFGVDGGEVEGVASPTASPRSRSWRWSDWSWQSCGARRAAASPGWSARRRCGTPRRFCPRRSP